MFDKDKMPKLEPARVSSLLGRVHDELIAYWAKQIEAGTGKEEANIERVAAMRQGDAIIAFVIPFIPLLRAMKKYPGLADMVREAAETPYLVTAIEEAIAVAKAGKATLQSDYIGKAVDRAFPDAAVVREVVRERAAA